MIGAKTLVTLTLLALGIVAAASFGVLAPERLLARGWGTLFFVGCFAVVVGTLMFRFWRLGEPSLHYFRWGTQRRHWSSTEEAHFVGGEGRRITLGDNKGEAFDLGPRVHRMVCVALALLLALACIDARSLGLLDRFEESVTKAGATYCPDPATQPPAPADPNVPGCELMRRAYALGYVKSLGECAPKAEKAAAAAPCTRRQRDEPALHYAWRLLKGSWGKLSKNADTAYAHKVQADFGTGVTRLEHGESQMLASAAHASHHLWTNLPDPGLDPWWRADSCAERYRWMGHRPAPTKDKRASQVLDHVLGQLLFEIRYDSAAGTCREFHVHWGAPLDACKRLAANPAAVLASTDVRTVIEHDRAGREPVQPIVSFQCYFEGDTAAQTSTPFTFAGQPLTVGEMHVAPSPPGATLYTDRYDALARLLAPGFHYGALLSDAGIDSASSAGMQAAFSGHDYLLTRLYGLDSLDIYLDAGWIGQRPDLLEVYPYERHLANYVQLFRRQYARLRGRL